MKKVVLASFVLSLLFIGCGDTETDVVNETETISTEEKIDLKISEETVDINGVSHYIKTMGEGEPLLVLHGGPGIFHDYLVPHFETLAKDYQVIFYDQRACGKTAFPEDTSSITIETYVEDLEGIRNHLKIDKLNLIGHSWGSLLAIRYGLIHPENLNKLILVAPAPSNSTYFDETFANMQQKRSEEDTKKLIQTMMSKDFEVREKEAFRKVVLLGDKTNLADQEKVEELYAPMEFDETKANNLMIVNSLLERTYFNFDLADEALDKITCPSLIILGDLDNVPFASAQAIQDGLANCELKVIKKCGHYPFFESPKEFNSTVNGFINPDYEQ